MFHSDVVGAKSRNLDIFLCGNEISKHLFVKNSQGFDISVIEGVMGFYDGLGGNTNLASSHDLSNVLDAPVILILSTKGMGLSVSVLVKGFLEFLPNNIKGVILNNTSKSMYPIYKESLEALFPIKVLGFMPVTENEVFASRHLGLVTSQEIEFLTEKLDKLALLAKKHIDIKGIIELANSAPPIIGQNNMNLVLKDNKMTSFQVAKQKNLNAKKTREKQIKEESSLVKENIKIEEVNPWNKNSPFEAFSNEVDNETEMKSDVFTKPRIAVAKDKAFCFYYQDSIDLLIELDCEIVSFSPLADNKLPDSIDGLILGGGYPELYAKELSANKCLLSDIKNQVSNGLPTFAECGGFMYLCENINVDDTNYQMVNAINGTSKMTSSLKRFGYIYLVANRDNLVCKKGEIIRAHEFHYSDSDYCGDDFIAIKASEYESIVRDKNQTSIFEDLALNNDDKENLNTRSDLFLLLKGKYPKTTRTCIVATDTLFAGYPHIHLWSNPEFAINFTNKCKNHKKQIALQRERN